MKLLMGAKFLRGLHSFTLRLNAGLVRQSIAAHAERLNERYERGRLKLQRIPEHDRQYSRLCR